MTTALLGAFVLAAAFAVADALLHGGHAPWLERPVATTRSLAALIACYAAGTVFATAALRRTRIVTGLAVSTFVVAQGGLRLYRAGFPSFSEAILFGAGLLGLALLLAAVAAAVAVRLMARPRWVAAAALAPAALSIAAFALPVPPPAAPDAWPAPRSASGAGRHPNVLLITLDTLRADRVGAYGYSRIETPHLDAIAREGVLFERAIAQAPLTPVSHASILTGVYPWKHRVRFFSTDDEPSAEFPLVAEILHRKGYVTGALVAAPTLAPAFGLDRGFDLYQFVPPPDRYVFSGLGRSLVPTALGFLGLVVDTGAYRSGSRQTDDALRWLSRYGDAPFFLWVHYFDAHDPYRPPPRTRDPALHPGRRDDERSGRSFEYDCEVVGLDQEVGRLVQGLGARGLLDRTVVALLSDHGEGLGDHGYFGHTKRLFQEQLRLVLALRYPAGLPRGRRIPTQVRSVDVLPTLLELLGIDPPPRLDGASLLPLLDPPEDAPDRVAFSETFAPSDPDLRLVAVSDGRYKLIRSLSGERWLFDLAVDPDERSNRAGEPSPDAQRLEKLLDAYLQAGAPGSTDGAVVGGELRQKLEALGYLSP